MNMWVTQIRFGGLQKNDMKFGESWDGFWRNYEADWKVDTIKIHCVHVYNS